jgi:hypothetical protein
MGKIRIRDGKKYGSGINIPDPQHCAALYFYGVSVLTGAWGAAATFFRKSSLFFFQSSFWSCTFFHSSSRGFLPVQSFQIVKLPPYLHRRNFTLLSTREKIYAAPNTGETLRCSQHGRNFTLVMYTKNNL